MLSIEFKGDFSKLNKKMERMKEAVKLSDLDKYGRQGVEALSAATPVDTGLTANSWSYEIERKNDTISIVFKNSNIVDGYPIAIILQYGHVTGNGGWVEGIDYINPALKPLFEKIAEDAWKEVKKA